ncbi:MAG TPA: glycosyltransferase family 4 protein [Chitinophagaceae bacterium]|nr:glycosyltransferase family 4 protein [Chitinophagaceae bacterium]
MSIIIFGDLFSFPEGGAATNRVYSYAKGFKENGVNPYVICFSSEYTTVDEGAIDGIPYFYPFAQRKRSPYFIVRRWQTLQKYFRAYRLTRRINKNDRLIAINSWSNLLVTHIAAWFFSKACKTKMIIECNEHPLRLHQGSAFNKKFGKIKANMEAVLCDGMLCISRFLVDFFEKRGVSKKKLFLVPSTVDPFSFSQNGSTPVPGKYVGYFGSLSFKRDNVDLLINAFARFNSSFPGVRLILGGFYTPVGKKQIVEMIETLGIGSSVQVLDLLSRKEILRYITNADILVMTRSKDLESDASYPSKLTEFLATGKPVISVNVGEISDFLIDKEQAFLVAPGDVQALTEKMLFVFNNYEFARQVGQRGKELTGGIFNYNYQAKRMIGFINSLNN